VKAAAKPPAKKVVAKKAAPPVKAPAKSPAKKVVASTKPVVKAPAKSAKAPAKKIEQPVVQKAALEKVVAEKAVASKPVAEKAVAPKPEKVVTTNEVAPPVKAQATKAAAPVKAPAAPKAPAKPAGYANDQKFLDAQREALYAERLNYLDQAKNLRAEAESLVEEMEPGDIQFDEESGEGGTVTVDRERDLVLSAQALSAVEEIDAALDKIKHGRYGICDRCGETIPKARLEALPYASLCVACKSGGLSRR
jgi:RNA polymerase-binding transcription factor DksA